VEKKAELIKLSGWNPLLIIEPNEEMEQLIKKLN
jgi:hypothetical protein